MTRLSFDDFTTIPRVSGLALSPDGRRLVLTAEALSPDGARFVSSLWEVTADGSSAPRRLTFSEDGEKAAAFLPDGSLLFVSARHTTAEATEEAEASLWVLPAEGGEAQRVLTVPGGIADVAVATGTDVSVVRAQRFGGARLAGDADHGRRRREAGVTATLYDTYPPRWWDRTLGPRWHHLLRLRGTAPADAQDLTPDAENTIESSADTEAPGYSVAPDGSAVVSTWARQLGGGRRSFDLVLIRDGQRERISPDGYAFSEPQFSPDGRMVAAIAHDVGSVDRARRLHLWLYDVESGAGRIATPDFDLWPTEPRWSHDSSCVYFAADCEMQRPIYRYDTADGSVTRITHDGSFHTVCPAPEAGVVYSLRTSWRSPLEAVRVDADGTVTALPTPGLPLELPSSVTPLRVRAADGALLHATLVMPNDASAHCPAPLVLCIHGGPFSSWNSWTWRWCPHLFAEHGYAVLLVDPALSTGYGQDFIQRAWGTWGDVVMRDLLTALDDVVQRDDIDEDRVAAIGGSFGGYVANWIAGHSDRFRAIVSHAGLWSFEQFHATTDEPAVWEHEFGSVYERADAYAAASPDRSVAAIRTPMLVTHGDRDYRVPITESLRLWTELHAHDVPSQYLYFPDENHWILKPGNSRVWYETVFAFLDHHVRDMEYRRPELL